MSNSSELTAGCYLTALKGLLRQRNVTYSQLADALECSLPTIKRWLNKPNVPLDRVLEIAEVANIEFAEICERANELSPQHFLFSDEQDALFVDRPEMLDYFMELMDGKSPKEIAKEYDLNARSSNLYQKHLAQVGLIKRKPRDEVKLLVSPPVGFGAGSRYLKRELENFLTSVVTDVVQSDERKEGNFALLKPMSLAKQDYTGFIEGIKRLINQYSAISERKIANDETEHYQVAVASGRGPEPKPSNLPRISK